MRRPWDVVCGTLSAGRGSRGSVRESEGARSAVAARRCGWRSQQDEQGRFSTGAGREGQAAHALRVSAEMKSRWGEPVAPDEKGRCVRCSQGFIVGTERAC